MNPIADTIKDVIGGALGPVRDVISEVVVDKDERERLAAALRTAELNMAGKIALAARDVIVAEAQGEGWLQRSWRPITMLVFTGLVVAKWLGLTDDGVTPAIEADLLAIIKLGLGGYVLGRSGEKIAKAVAPVVRGPIVGEDGTRL